MLRIKSAYAHVRPSVTDAPIGLSIVREDGTRLVCDLDVVEASDLLRDLSAAILKVATAGNRQPVHTVGGKVIGPEGSPYGVTHDHDCPACQDTPFTASPRSETYWSS